MNAVFCCPCRRFNPCRYDEIKGAFVSRTLIKRITAAFAIALALMAAFVLLGTWYVNQEPFQNRVRAVVADRAGKMFTFQKLRLSLFPRPRVTVLNPMVTVPDRIDLSLRSATIYPEVLPLFSGKIRISRLDLERPELTVTLAEEPGAKPEDPSAVFEEARSEIRSAVEAVQDIAPDFHVEIGNGLLVFRSKQEVLSRMSDISGIVSLLPHGFGLDLKGKTLRWGLATMKGSVQAGKNSIAVKDFSISGGKSSISHVTGRFRWKKSPYAKISSGQAAIFLEDVQERRQMLGELNKSLSSIKSMSGLVSINSFSFIGPLLHTEQWQLNATGNFHDVAVQADLLPGAVGIEAGSFAATMQSFSVAGLDASFLDSTVTTTGSMTGPLTSPQAGELSLRGRIGRETISWSAKKFDLPRDLIVRAPCSISGLRFRWKKDGTIALSGSASLNGPMLSIDMRRNAKEIRIDRLAVQDEKNRAVMVFRKTADLLDLAFQGTLTEDTVNRMFERASGRHGWIRGDMALHLLLKSPGQSKVRGTLAAADLFFPFPKSPLTVRTLDLGSRDGTVAVNTASILWGDLPLDITGRLNARDEALHADLDVAARDLSVEGIMQLFGGKRKTGEERAGGTFSGLPLQGVVRVSAQSIKWGRYVFKPVRADVLLDRNSVRMQILDAKLCGVSLPGNLRPLDDGILFAFQPGAVAQPLEPFLDCISSNKRMDGTFALAGSIRGKGKGTDLIRSLDGSIYFTAVNGRIYTYPLLARVLFFLNVSQLLLGQMPDMGKDGFAYKSIRIKGDIKSGKLVLKEAVVEGSTLNLVADGEIDFATDQIDVTILVAPFKTIEYILSKIPLLRNVLANKLVTVPVRLTGDRNNPDVTPLDPAATGEHLLDLMEGILKLPFKVLSPSQGDGNEKK
jgi:hypothetical protein